MYIYKNIYTNRYKNIYIPIHTLYYRYTILTILLLNVLKQTA